MCEIPGYSGFPLNKHKYDINGHHKQYIQLDNVFNYVFHFGLPGPGPPGLGSRVQVLFTRVYAFEIFKHAYKQIPFVVLEYTNIECT